MMQQRQIAINASNGAFTIIRCSLGSVSKMWIVEDGASNAGAQEGLEYNLLRLPTAADTLTPANTLMVVDTSGYQRLYFVEPLITVAAALAPEQEPIKIEGYPGDHPPNTAPIGNGGSYPNASSPGGPITDGTPILQIRSAGAATNINVTEWSA